MAKILVVEDENIVAWDIKETLEKLGHTVVDLSVSGADAIEAAAIDSPDLVLMDIRLTGEMDGITAGDEIYQQLHIPVVYLTAHADELTLMRAAKTNPFGYIIKPFQSQSLQSTIKIALQRHQLEAASYLDRAYLESALHSIGSGVITTDRQGLVTFMNPTAEDLTGWHLNEAMGLNINQTFRLVWESDGSEIENPSVRSIRLQQPVKSPDRCWLVARDGSEIPISDLATPIVSLDGEIVGSIVVFQDNTEHLSIRTDLLERNQDLEAFQLQLISQLQAKTAEYQQATACIQLLDLALNDLPTARSEGEMLDCAIRQLGTIVGADYCWCTLHNSPTAKASIISEYINRERQICPTSKIGQEIDPSIYPQFYKHLFEGESWIDPSFGIAPSLYLNLWPPAANMLIFPIVIAPQKLINRQDRTIGEVGIITTGKPPWTTLQASQLAQIFSCAVKLFRQSHRQQIEPESIE